MNRAPSAPVEFAIVASANSAPALRVAYADGWSPQQWNGHDTWRWGTGATAVLSLRNGTSTSLTVGVSFLAQYRGA